MAPAKHKAWSCNRECGSNCCDHMILPLDKRQKRDFKRTRAFWIAHNYTDLRWLGYHDWFTLEKFPNGHYLLRLAKDKPFELKDNPYISQVTFLYVKSKCKQLMPDNRCLVYETRPRMCRIARCPVYSAKPVLNWFGWPIRERDSFDPEKAVPKELTE